MDGARTDRNIFSFMEKVQQRSTKWALYEILIIFSYLPPPYTHIPPTHTHVHMHTGKYCPAFPGTWSESVIAL